MKYIYYMEKQYNESLYLSVCLSVYMYVRPSVRPSSGRPLAVRLCRLTRNPQPLTACVRVPVWAKTFMWGGIPAYLRCVGGST